ncbi:hypothetical protein OG21DRAFT_836790 [Imleria badia]|nr:hypothetical protein OG21DRAFT_836790 [Imleria badia]
MRNPLTISKSPTPRQPEPVFLHEYQSHRFERHGHFDINDYRTTLFVVFDGETQRRFSSVRIMLYYTMNIKIDVHHSWGIQQLEPVTRSGRDPAVHQLAPQNDPTSSTLPQLTVAFQVIPHPTGEPSNYYHLIPPPSNDKLRCHWGSKSARILMESNHSITPDTLSVSVPLQHSRFLVTLSNHRHYWDAMAYVTTRTVQVVANDACRRITISYLPAELLLKIFEVTDSSSCASKWQHDLLSFAQVCRQWSQHSMSVLLARLEFIQSKKHCYSFPTQYLHTCVFAQAFSKTPFLGLGVEHLYVDEQNGSWICREHSGQKISAGFAPELRTILRATKNLQRLHLSQIEGYFAQENRLFSALPRLDHLHTLSITRTTCQIICPWIRRPRARYWEWSINTVQLARCMARWSALTCLTVENLAPGNIGMGRFFLRPPTCALTQLCIRDSSISDKELLHLTTSSANTLAHVTLDHIQGITYDGLHVFLDSISRNVISLTIWNVPSSCSCRNGNHALDNVVDKMRCLEVLDICGDVANELMLRRRSEMFLRDRGSGVPVVRLTFQSVPPGIRNCVGQEWAGWEVVELH